jgi:hypothetical protein
LFNKQGKMEWMIAGIIITLVVAGIIFWVVPEIIKEGKQASLRETCKTSVLLRAKSKILGNPILDNLKCETIHFEIDSTNEEIIKEQISTEMFSCWNMFDRGESDFLSDRDFGKGDNWCHICSRIDFSDSVQKNKDTKVVDNFDQYLRDEEIPIIGKSFYAYIYGEEQSELLEPFPEEYNIKTDETVYVVFFADKRVDWSKNLGESSLAALGGAVLCAGGVILSPITFGTTAAIGCSAGGAIIGTAYATSSKHTYLNGLYVGPASKIIEVCGQ